MQIVGFLMMRLNYDKRDDFDIVHFPFLDGDVPLMLYIYIIQVIRFARASSHVTDFNNHNKF